MTRNLRIFLVTFLLSMPFWLGADAFARRAADFFFWHALATDPSLLAAQASAHKLGLEMLSERPILKSDAPPLRLASRASFSVLLREDGTMKTLFQDHADQELPIASISKLMTALVVLEQYPLDQKISIGARALQEEGPAGDLKSGDVFAVKDLLYSMLMESSNRAATALALVKGKAEFVGAMNQEAEHLGLAHTRFVNPHGLDEGAGLLSGNYSTAEDLSKLVTRLLRAHPQVFDILSLRDFNLYRPDGTFHHTILNTNELLEYRGWPTEIVGGKTGYTDKAKGCLVLVLKGPKDKGYIINMILGSDDRFGEMKTMVDWTYTSYAW